MGLLSTTHRHHTKTVSVPYEKSVTVNEHRAPTDKSVELLNEFEKKAHENIIYKTKIEQNHLKAIAIYYQDDIVSNRMHFHVKFELNGFETLISDFVDGFEWRTELSKLYFGFGNEAIFKLVHKKLSEMIALDLMKQSPDFMGALANER